MQVAVIAMKEYQVIVVGGGTAGLSTGIFCSERGLSVAVFEGGSFGGALATVYPTKLVTNYPGFPEGVGARELAELLVMQAREYGVELRRERVVEITPELKVKTLEGVYSASAIVIATGTRPKELGIPGEADFNYGDLGVYYSLADPAKLANRRVIVVGGGDSALEAAAGLSQLAEVTLVHRRSGFRAVPRNVDALRSSSAELLLDTELEEIGGENRVEWVRLRSGEESFTLKADAVVLAIGHVPNTEIFQKLGLECDVDGRIKTGQSQLTSLKGVYAAGDVVAGAGQLELLVVAVAHGAIAAHNIYLELFEPF